MDKDSEKQVLENELAAIEAWKAHPLTQDLLKHTQEQAESLINLLCNRTPHSLETLISHFESIGHLRCLRNVSGVINERTEQIKQELKDL